MPCKVLKTYSCPSTPARPQHKWNKRGKQPLRTQAVRNQNVNRQKYQRQRRKHETLPRAAFFCFSSLLGAGRCRAWAAAEWLHGSPSSHPAFAKAIFRAETRYIEGLASHYELCCCGRSTDRVGSYMVTNFQRFAGSGRVRVCVLGGVYRL